MERKKDTEIQAGTISCFTRSSVNFKFLGDSYNEANSISGPVV